MLLSIKYIANWSRSKVQTTSEVINFFIMDTKPWHWPKGHPQQQTLYTKKYIYIIVHFLQHNFFCFSRVFTCSVWKGIYLCVNFVYMYMFFVDIMPHFIAILIFWILIWLDRIFFEHNFSEGVFEPTSIFVSLKWHWLKGAYVTGLRSRDNYYDIKLSEHHKIFKCQVKCN